MKHDTETTQRLVRQLREPHSGTAQEKIEDELCDSLDGAGNETLAGLLRDPHILTRRLHDGLLREALARLLLRDAG